MKQHPHGIDFGPLEPRLPEMLRTVSGKVELAPPALLADLPRLEQSMYEVDDEQLVLVGRRHLRSNNSWMHNIEVLVKGKPRCTLQMHPNDAARVGVKEGEQARITSRVGHVDAVVEYTSDIRERVVSLPHGWGHDMSGTQMNVAAQRAGVNSNVLTDHNEMDPLSGNSVMNGIPVTVSALVEGVINRLEVLVHLFGPMSTRLSPERKRNTQGYPLPSHRGMAVTSHSRPVMTI